MHWAVRPVIFTLGILTALKLGMFVGNVSFKAVGRNKKPSNQVRLRSGQQSLDVQNGGQDPQNSGNASWLPPSVANILFREGVTSTR